MEANDEKKAGTEIDAGQAGEVGGGDATATIGTCGGSITSNGATAGSALIDIYEGAVELTTHVIERVVAK